MIVRRARSSQFQPGKPSGKVYKMVFSRLKISTKLLISSAVFLIPVGIMLFMIISGTAAAIRKNKDERYGISCLRPAVQLFQKVPQRINMPLGLEPGDLFQIDSQIDDALRDLDASMNRYGTALRPGNEPGTTLRASWESIKAMKDDDAELFTTYAAFMQSLRETVIQIGEQSSLILVSDMGSYYFINIALSVLPEAALRFSEIDIELLTGRVNASDLIQTWNEALLAQQAQGRRLTQTVVPDSPGKLTVNMLPIEDRQIIRNTLLLLNLDRERILAGLKDALENSGADPYGDLDEKREEYQKAAAILLEQNKRLTGFNIPDPVTVEEMIGGLDGVNEGVCRLWFSVLNQLDLIIDQNISASGRRMAWYLIFALLTVFLAFVVVIFSTLDINRSVKSLRTLFKGLNENDLTLALEVNSGDEFGELMTAFNGFLDILRSTFGSFKQSAQLVADSVFDLSSSAKEITTTANEQSASVSEIVSTMESSKNLSEQIAEKTTEVAGLASQTQDLSRKGAELRAANQMMMEDIREQNSKIINEIRNLTDMINRISEAIRIIDGIADQTKLIAFNASLEASSSGETGARFSVVAGEIRRFADNVVESTREIKQKIEEVQGASQTLIAEANSGSKQIELGYERMGEQETVFENIVNNSQNVATRSQQISNLSKQQELASSQIFTALKEISVGVKQFVTATSSTSKTADGLSGMSKELRDKVDRYRTA
jgi:methyl-accepting chemotaxis protein